MLADFLGGSIRAAAPMTSGVAEPERWFTDLVGGGMTATGLRVSQRDALTVPGIAACVQVLSDDLAKVPLILYRRLSDGGRQRAIGHPLFKLLNGKPAPWLSSFMWRKSMFQTAAVTGNSYSPVTRSVAGVVTRMHLPSPNSVTPRWALDGEPFYDMASGPNGSKRGLTYQDMVHFAYRGGTEHAVNGGFYGRSPLDSHKETIALALATEIFAAKYFRNGARPSAVIETDKTFPNDAVADRMRRQLENVLSGVDNAGKFAILEMGLKLKEWSANNNDSQLVEVRKSAAVAFATMFRIPPHKIGILDNATFSNIESQAMEYVGDALVPLAAMSEQQLEIALLSDFEQDEYFIEYDLDGLLRGDIVSRYRAYSIGRQWGWLSADDVRDAEYMNRLPNGQGQVYMTPLNMIDSGNNTAKDDSLPGESRNRGAKPANT